MSNKQELIKLRDMLLSFPENFNYKDIVLRKDNPHSWEANNSMIPDIVEHDCNSCGCLVGYTTAMYWQEFLTFDFSECYRDRRYHFAAEKLELNEGETEFLFSPNTNGKDRSHYSWEIRNTGSCAYLKGYSSSNWIKNQYYRSQIPRVLQVAEAVDRINFIIENAP